MEPRPTTPGKQLVQPAVAEKLLAEIEIIERSGVVIVSAARHAADAFSFITFPL